MSFFSAKTWFSQRISHLSQIALGNETTLSMSFNPQTKFDIFVLQHWKIRLFRHSWSWKWISHQTTLSISHGSSLSKSLSAYMSSCHSISHPLLQQPTEEGYLWDFRYLFQLGEGEQISAHGLCPIGSWKLFSHGKMRSSTFWFFFEKVQRYLRIIPPKIILSFKWSTANPQIIIPLNA